MSDPTPSPEALAAARAQLEQQAGAVLGTDMAGIYGDPAGAGTPAPAQTPEQIAAGLVAKGATPMAADTGALLDHLAALAKQVQDLQAAHDAAQPVPAEPAKPLKLHDLAGGAGAGVVHAFTLAEERLSALEDKLAGKDKPAGAYDPAG
jgi:hypothetical protein